MKKFILIAAFCAFMGETMAQVIVWKKEYENYRYEYDTITKQNQYKCDTTTMAYLYRFNELDSIVLATLPPIAHTIEPQDDKVTILWHLKDATVCSKLVLVGNYNGWQTDDVSNMVEFEPVAGYDQWYVAAVKPSEEWGLPLQVKPCMLDIDGSFSWSYQWISTETNPCLLLGGSAALKNTYNSEVDIYAYKLGDVVVIESSEFKCNPCDYHYEDITFTVSTPALSTEYTLYITGDFNSWSPEPLTPNADRTSWTLQKQNVLVHGPNSCYSLGYKYLLNGDWSYVELGEKNASGCAESSGNRTIESNDIHDVVPNFLGVTADYCTE